MNQSVTEIEATQDEDALLAAIVSTGIELAALHPRMRHEKMLTEQSLHTLKKVLSDVKHRSFTQRLRLAQPLRDGSPIDEGQLLRHRHRVGSDAPLRDGSPLVQPVD